MTADVCRKFIIFSGIILQNISLFSVVGEIRNIVLAILCLHLFCLVENFLRLFAYNEKITCEAIKGVYYYQ